MTTKNIIIAPCGNKSKLFEECWLKYREEKDFDLCLLFYHEEILDKTKYSGADYFFHIRGFKYHMIHKLLTELHPEWLERYRYFYFLDDDIEIDTRQINTMFALSRAMNSRISQASLTRDSYCSWPMFKTRAGSFCRFVGQIEVMAPLFHADALKLCLPSFTANRSSWGIDSVWSKLLGYPEKSMLVFDTVSMRHTLPVGSGELYKILGASPHEEWEEVTRRFEARKHNYREYGRLLLVDKNHHRLRYLGYRISAWFRRLKRGITDYDVMSRVKSRTRKLSGKS